MKYIFALAIAAIVLSLGCTYGTKQSVLQKEDSSSIRFLGDATGIQVQIDNDAKRTTDKSGGNELNAWNPRTLYRITPGKHQLRIYRSDSLIVNNVFFIGSNEIKEISLP